MRFNKYLTEKYYNTFKNPYNRKKSFDVFINPTTKELKEVIDGSDQYGQGYRYIVDTTKKKVYVFSLDMVHETIFDADPSFPKFLDYWMNGEMLGHIYTGHVEYGNDKSDALTHFYKLAKQEKNDIDKGITTDLDIMHSLDRLTKQDWSFAKKYVDVDTVLKRIKKASLGGGK